MIDELLKELGIEPEAGKQNYEEHAHTLPAPLPEEIEELIDEPVYD